MLRTLLFAVLIITLAAACRPKEPAQTDASMPDVVASNVDTTVNPAEDFFAFANGAWLAAHPIPASESRWGIGNVLQEDIYLKMRQVSENAAKANATKGSAEQKIGDFWSAGMDSSAVEANGLKPIQPELDLITAINSVPALVDAVVALRKGGLSPLYSSYVYQDEKQSDKNALYMYQGGLGLPDRDYYFNKDARTGNIRKSYKEHLAKMLVLLGEPEKTATQKADRVFEIESFLASKHRRLEDLRDPHANYNKMTIAELGKLSPSLGWTKNIAAMGFTTDTVIVGQPEFFQQLEAALKKFGIDDWKNYLRYQLVTEVASYLPASFSEENFNFYGVVLSGAKEQRPRWKRVLDAQEDALGEALGQLFVKSFFPETAKKRYSDMVEAVRVAFDEQIEELDWMTPETKTQTKAKLKRVSKKVGYPDKWKDFSNMSIDRSSYVRNVLNARRWWYEYNSAKLGKPVDRTEWDMTPQTYNAYYNPSNNEIVLPAAILMYPGYADTQVDDAVAYGYVAASTIGHEITHGFDDQGRQYDADGNLKMWWTPTDSVQFARRAQLLINQFNEFVPIDTMHVRGEATLGENIADLGGLVIGLRAFKKTDQYKKGEKVAGYTPLQRYFMGYAYGWMTQSTDERLAQQLMTDYHAPAFLRVNGPMANIPEFYEAFGVKENNKMWRDPAKRAKIW